MQVEPYRRCQRCGRELEITTQYRQHAYCPDCGPVMPVR